MSPELVDLRTTRPVSRNAGRMEVSAHQKPPRDSILAATAGGMPLVSKSKSTNAGLPSTYLMFSPARAIVLGRGLAASSLLVAIKTSSPNSARIAPSAMAWFDSSFSISGPSCSMPLSLTRRARPCPMLQALPSDLTLPSTRLMRLVRGPRSFVRTTSSMEFFSFATNGTPLFGDARGQGGIRK
jgi:hypothetical protein